MFTCKCHSWDCKVCLMKDATSALEVIYRQIRNQSPGSAHSQSPGKFRSNLNFVVLGTQKSNQPHLQPVSSFCQCRTKMPRALAPGPLLFIWSPSRAWPCFLRKKQMEERKRTKATKPFCVSIVLPVWGAEWEKGRLFVRAPDSTREEHISKQRIMCSH